MGDGADVSVQAAAQSMGLELPENFQARQINPERDIVCFDVVLVMDKFTAADVLREVYSFSHSIDCVIDDWTCGKSVCTDAHQLILPTVVDCFMSQT